MKKVLIITFGIVLILGVLGVWVYLVMFGTPDSIDTVFTNLPDDGSEVERPEIVPEPEEKPAGDLTIDIASSELAQLTTRPVAGFVHLQSSTTDTIRYAERGTGHIFDISLDTGKETKVVGTTIPRVVEVTFSRKGSMYALTTENAFDTKTVFGAVGSSSPFAITELPLNSEDVVFTSESSIRYTAVEEMGTARYGLDILAGESSLHYTTPFRDIQAVYRGYFYNKPAPMMLGGIYQPTNGILTALEPARYGQVFMTSPGGQYINTYFNLDTQELESYHHKNGETQRLPVVMIPEKCSFTPDTRALWCAAGNNTTSRGYINNWYKGAITSEDSLVQIDLRTLEVNTLYNLAQTSGFTVDVENLVVSRADDKIFFTNKLNDTLWLYRTKQTEVDIPSDTDGQATTTEELP